MVRVMTGEDQKRIKAALKKEQPKFRFTFTFEPTVSWIETIQPGVFSVVMELDDIIGDDLEGCREYTDALAEEGVEEPNVNVIVRFIENVLNRGYGSLHGFICEDMGLGDHLEFVDLDVEDET